MMLARHFSIACEMLIEHFAILYSGHIDHAPSGNAVAAFSADLPAKQTNNSALNAVVVRLYDALVPLIGKPNQSLMLNCAAEQLIQI